MPDDMWANISRELDKDANKALKRKHMAKRLESWKPALAFAAAAGVFWLAIIPTDSPARMTLPRPVGAEANAESSGQNDLLQEVSHFVRTEKKPAQDSAATQKYGFVPHGVSVQ